ncbi:MAG: hypothetical protein J5531_03290 [Lachnospiraceae bacterium]|nr:hypothetical protein [Lachnospiraceae bacterium]
MLKSIGYDSAKQALGSMKNKLREKVVQKKYRVRFQKALEATLNEANEIGTITITENLSHYALNEMPKDVIDCVYALTKKEEHEKQTKISETIFGISKAEKNRRTNRFVKELIGNYSVIVKDMIVDTEVDGEIKLMIAEASQMHSTSLSARFGAIKQSLNDIHSLQKESLKKQVLPNTKDVVRYLHKTLENKRKVHRSYLLMGRDSIDERLYPNVDEFCEYDSYGILDQKETEKPVWDIIRESWTNTNNTSIVLEGAGGIGKTVTLLRAADQQELENQIPVMYIPMFDLVDGCEVIAIDEYVRRSNYEYKDIILKCFSLQWDNGPSFVLLLDGLNEIFSINCRRNLIQHLNEWHINHPGVQIIAVSRPVDGINLRDNLLGEKLVITLSPISQPIVIGILQERGAYDAISSNDSALWDYLVYPLFLTLYLKSANLNNVSLPDYKLDVKTVIGPGTIIWNFLQRELLRIESMDPSKSEDWIVRCSLVCEYILPQIAHKMIEMERTTLSQDEIMGIIKQAVYELRTTEVEAWPTHLKEIMYTYKKIHFLYPDLKSINWNEAVFNECGLLCLYDSHALTYEFLHQHFRDFLGAIHLVNQAQQASTSVPKCWGHSYIPSVMDYVAEMITEDIAYKLWECNRQHHSETKGIRRLPRTTSVLMEFWSNYGLPEILDFSGMDLRERSISRYINTYNKRQLVWSPNTTKGTRLDEKSFITPGHTAAITFVTAVSNKCCMSGACDATFHMWDINTGETLLFWNNRAANVIYAEAISNGYIMASDDGWMGLWSKDFNTCNCVRRGDGTAINCFITLSDECFLYGMEDGSLRVLDLNLSKERIIGEHGDAIAAIALLPDGKVLSGSYDSSVRMWDIDTGEYKIIGEHHDAVSCIAYLPEKHCISGSWDGTLRVWELDSDECYTLKGHDSEITCLAVLPDGRCVSGDNKGKILIWNLNERTHSVVCQNNYRVTCLGKLPGGRWFSGWENGVINVFDLCSGDCLYTLCGYEKYVCSCCTLPDGQIICGVKDGSLRFWDSHVNRCTEYLRQHVWMEYNSSVVRTNSPSTNQIGSVGALNKKTDRFNAFVGVNDGIRCVARLSDKQIAYGTFNGFVGVWDMERKAWNTLGKTNTVTSIAVLANGRFVSCANDGHLYLWDALAGSFCAFKELQCDITCVAAISDVNCVSGSDDGRLRIWDTRTGEYKTLGLNDDEPITCIATLNADCCVTGSSDGMLQRWNLVTGEKLVIGRHAGAVTCIAVSSDGQCLSGGTEKRIHITNPETKEFYILSKDYDFCFSDVCCLASGPDGCFVSGYSDGEVYIWDIKDNGCQFFNIMEVNVLGMDFSATEISEKFARTLWENGAIVSEKHAKKIKKKRWYYIDAPDCHHYNSQGEVKVLNGPYAFDPLKKRSSGRGKK